MLDLIHTMVVEHPYWMMMISFVLAVFTDVVWAKWSHAIKIHNAICAANWSAFIYLFGIVYTLVVMEKDLLQIIAYVAGAWVGTYLAVLHIKKKTT